MAKAAAGDFEAAWQDTLACQRLGRQLARGGTLIEDLVGIALVTIATNAEVTLIGHGTHTSKRLLAWQADLRALPLMPSMADKMALSERFMTLDSILSIAYHGPGGLAVLTGSPGPKVGKNELLNRMFSRSIDFDPAFRNANQMFDQCEAACRQPDRASRKKAFDEIEAEVRRRKGVVMSVGPVQRLTMSRAARGEHIGNVLIGLLLPSLGKIMDANDRLEQTQANLQVALALAAYRADTGRYPARLDELAPKYIAAVPGDLFSGTPPLIYRPSQTGYLLYSVGVNGVDDDGRWTDDDPRGDDLRVRMPVEEPRAKDGRSGR
jgi:type II secretory pathway pseudopilin PulG